MNGGVVSAVEPGSIAEALGIQAGDLLLEINGHALRDVLDVQYYGAEEELELRVRRGQQEVLLQVERDYDVPLGLDFQSPTFDSMRLCDNRCEFCFVTQMPPGLRRSLYARDDDYRYSVLYGSFVTLTNLTAEDWDRFQEQRLSPLYVSVHAVEPGIRRHTLGRAEIPDIREQLDRLAELGIVVHCQIVLTPGINDGPHLAQTVADLAARHPAVQSIAIVPVGLTRYHRGGCRRYTAAEARGVIEQVAPWQRTFRRRFGLSLVYLADEWYLLAEDSVPPDEMYDDYPQIENGIGLVRQFLDDSARLRKVKGVPTVTSCTLVCGTLMAPLMRQAARDLARALEIQVHVVPVGNRLFGDTVTVSGLLGAEDILAGLQEEALGEVVVVPRAMFADYTPGREEQGPPRTLDDWTLAQMADRLGCRVEMAGWISEVWSVLTGVDPWP